MSKHIFDSYSSADSPNLKPGRKIQLKPKEKKKRPYKPRATCCAYKLKVGETFYIGSTSNLVARIRDHAWRLKKGIHPSPKLQESFNNGGEISHFTLELVKHSTCPDELRARLRAAEQEKIDFQFNDPLCANISPNASGPNNGEFFKNKWLDPEFREKMTSFLKDRKGAAVSKETRAKMAIAKTGANNVKSRPVSITSPDAKKSDFPSVSDAAKFLGVPQQVMDGWLSGKFAWPGTGKRPARPQYQHLVGWKAEYK